MCVPPIIAVQNWHWLQWDFSAKTKKVFYFLTKVLCSCHLYVLVVWRVFVFFPFQKILPFDMTLSLPLNNNMSHTEGILLFCGHHLKERISSNKKHIYFYDKEKTPLSINDVYLFYFRQCDNRQQDGLLKFSHFVCSKPNAFL